MTQDGISSAYPDVRHLSAVLSSRDSTKIATGLILQGESTARKINASKNKAYRVQLLLLRSKSLPDILVSSIIASMEPVYQ